MSELTNDLLGRRGVKRPCCGTCMHWMTEMMIGGQYCGWLGSCCNPDSPADRNVEADDWCRLWMELHMEEAENEREGQQ